MWDVGESGVKIVCTAVLDGKGITFCILLGAKMLKSKFKFVFNVYIFISDYLLGTYLRLTISHF